MRISMRIVAVLVLVLGICLFLGKASSVRGAPTQVLVAIGNRDRGDYLWAVDANGTIYRSNHGGSDPLLVVGQLPATAPPVSICVLTFDVFIALSNGDVYDVGASSGPVTPVFIQNVFGGGPTSLSPATWGKLKSRFGALKEALIARAHQHLFVDSGSEEARRGKSIPERWGRAHD